LPRSCAIRHRLRCRCRRQSPARVGRERHGGQRACHERHLHPAGPFQSWEIPAASFLFFCLQARNELTVLAVRDETGPDPARPPGPEVGHVRRNHISCRVLSHVVVAWLTASSCHQLVGRAWEGLVCNVSTCCGQAAVYPTQVLCMTMGASKHLLLNLS
jgi:hypothetical protein